MLGAALAAGAEAIYKQQLPDGSVVYSDHRIKGAKLLYKVSIPDEPTAPVGQAAPPGAKTEAAALDQRLRERSDAFDLAQREIISAEQALEQAKRQLDAGKEPLPGEIQSSAMGGSRVLPEYYDRVKKLEDSVAQAQARLARAYEARNQLR